MGISQCEFIGLENLTLTESDTVNASASKAVNIQPPVGIVYQIIMMRAHAADPAGSSAGTHKFRGYYKTAGSNGTCFLCSSNTGGAVAINLTSWVGTASKQPADLTDQIALIGNGMLWSDHTEYFVIRYENDTDVNQTGPRTLEVVVKKYRGF